VPSVSDIISIQLNLDTSGLQTGQQQAQAAIQAAKQAIQQQGSEIERVAKNVGFGLETLIKNVAGFFGLVLTFEGFKNLVLDAAQAGTSMGRFAESIGKTVEVTQAYRQAFSAFTGGETGILNAIRQIKLDLSAFPLVYTEWMNAVERLTGKTVRGKEPEQILQEINEAAIRRHMNAAQLHMWLGNALGLTDADILLLTKPGGMQAALKEQREKVGTPTTPQVQSMEDLQKDITNLQTVSELLALQTATLMQPFLHELITMTMNVLHWMRGMAIGLGMKGPPETLTQTSQTPQTFETPGGAVMVGPRTGIRRQSSGTVPSPESLIRRGVRGSMFNDVRTASGRSAATTAGIALPSGGKMGDLYEITTPDGRKFVAPLIDRGPANWTGRGVDISQPLAEQMGYGRNFPTDARFKVEPITPPTGVPSAITLHRNGAPTDAVDDALKLEGLHERRDRETIREYLRTGGAGMDPATTAWCAAFVNSSLQREGIPGTGSGVATSFLRWGSPVSSADVQKGDVLVQARGLSAGQTGGHVGMATGNTRMGPSGLEIEIIAGNTGDRVRRYWISANSVQVRRASNILGSNSQMPNVSTGAAASAANAAVNRPRVIENKNDSHINQIIVNTQATDASGIAQDVKDALGKHLELVPGD
jgi:uncharacterized protein (TIGR02594 family)